MCFSTGKATLIAEWQPESELAHCTNSAGTGKKMFSHGVDGDGWGRRGCRGRGRGKAGADGGTGGTGGTRGTHGNTNQTTEHAFLTNLLILAKTLLVVRSKAGPGFMSVSWTVMFWWYALIAADSLPVPLKTARKSLCATGVEMPFSPRRSSLCAIANKPAALFVAHFRLRH